ncbi:MAG TPA: hypothetical protein PLR37_16470 [Candidatus Accumulibacter phosphatis]|nr:hypothetical protein [Accumulibacter sp.]HRF13683.1 hypothetical protein [Candidatus Accumulibacter phosphatis]
MSVTKRVDYAGCARRHFKDADKLHQSGGHANAGQLYGFSVECGLKALLIQSGTPADAEGGIAGEFKEHMPRLAQMIAAMTTLPDGRSASALLAAVPHLGKMRDWKIEHRYWKVAALPRQSLPNWAAAAQEMVNHLDVVKQGSL